MAKTKAQLEKKKRDIEKRKKLDKLILKIAAAMPDEPGNEGSVTPTPEANSIQKPS